MTDEAEDNLIPFPQAFKSESLDPETPLQRRRSLGDTFRVERCVPVSVDVRGTWGDVRAALPGTKESFAVDRFLDTVVTRMKYTERRAEAAAL